MLATSVKISILVAADISTMYSLRVVLLLGALSFSSGWKVGQELEYGYTGTSVATVKGLGNQFAVVQLKGVLIAQAVDESTLTIRLSRVSAYSLPKFVGDLANIYDAVYDVEGQSLKLEVSDNEAIERPFQVFMQNGTVRNISVSPSDPIWVINIKKSIADVIQLNSGAVHGSSPMFEKVLYHDEKEANTVVDIYENTIFGNCKVNFRTSRLTGALVLTDKEYDFVQKFCLKTTPVFELYKQIDLDSCSKDTKSLYNHILPSMHACRPDASKCGITFQRAAGNRYHACRSSTGDWRIVRAQAFDDSLVKPFGTNSQELFAGGVLTLDLRKVRTVEVALPVPENSITFSSLAYQFPESVNDRNEIAPPGFEDSPSTRPVNILEAQDEILQTVRDVAASIDPESGDRHIDTTDRLHEVLDYVAMLKLSEIQEIAKKVADEPSTVRFLLLDVLATAGTPATSKFVADILRSGKLEPSLVTPNVANIAMSLFYYIKIPSTEVLGDLMDLVKFSGKYEKDPQLHTTALMGMAELLFHACAEHRLSDIRFPTRTYGRFCSPDDAVYKEFVDYITGLLNGASTKFETMAYLTVAGTLGTSEMFPLLLPYVRGVADSSPSVRSRAVLALHRYAYLDRERVVAIVNALYDNRSENPEVRMAALAILLNSNAPFATWQKVAWNSWFEKNNQVAAFASSLVGTIAEIPEYQVQYSELINKAKAAKNFMKPSDYNNYYSSSKHRGSWSNSLNAGYLLHTPTWMSGHQTQPLAQSYRIGFQTGPDIIMLLQAHLWKYGIEDLYQKVYQAMSPPVKQSRPRAINFALADLGNLFTKLGIEKHPDEDTNTFIQITMLWNMHRLLSLDSIDKTWPTKSKNFDALLKKDGGLNLQVQKFRSWKETKISYPSVTGVPVTFENHIPSLASAHVKLSGNFKSIYNFSLEVDGNIGIAVDNIGQLRMDLPFVNSYVASGVESHLQIALPKKWELELGLENKANIGIRFSISPSEVKRNLFENKVTPFTIIGSVSDYKPLNEKSGFEKVHVSEPQKKSWNGLYGIFTVNSERPKDQNFARYDPVQWIFPGSLESHDARVPLPEKIRTMSDFTVAFQRTKVMKYDPARFNFFAAGSTSEAPRPLADSIDGYDFENDTEIKGGKLFHNKLTTSTAGKAIASVVVRSAQDYDGLQKIVDVVLSIGDKAKCLKFRRQNPALSTFECACSTCPVQARASLIFGEGEGCNEKLAEGEIIYTRTEEQLAYAETSPEYKACQTDMEQGIMASQDCHKARILAETYDKMSIRIPGFNKLNTLHDMGQILRRINQFFGMKFKTKQVEDDGAFLQTVTFTHDGKSFDVATRCMGEEVTMENSRNYFKGALPFTPRQSITDLIASLGVRGENPACYISRNRVQTFDGVTYNYTIDTCPHLVTSDCSSRSKFAVLVMQETNGNLGLRVITEFDRYHISSKRVVDLNLQKEINLDENGIMMIKDGRVSSALYKQNNGDYLLVLPRETLSVYFKGNDIIVKSSAKNRGRLCGLCGDMNFEQSMEFFDPKRCALSSGALMATSYRIQTNNCPDLQEEQKEALDLYRQECQSIDETIRSALPIAKKQNSSQYRANCA
ncbi:uncharacterized protein LOC136033813 [Artemia franciscana]|uniref:Vitellogenin n=1 Tax=Artemia franciscana TaxID=6661 RepID=A0AA88LH31_ARTSF|nr:hypothetical protein QYM36_002253 [Artemia franciscana]